MEEGALVVSFFSSPTTLLPPPPKPGICLITLYTKVGWLGSTDTNAD